VIPRLEAMYWLLRSCISDIIAQIYCKVSKVTNEIPDIPDRRLSLILYKLHFTIALH